MLTTRPAISCLLLLLICGLWAPPSAAQAQLRLDDVPTVEVQSKRKPQDTAWQPRDTVTLAQLPGYRADPDTGLTPYGGTLHQRRRATGYFRTEQVNGNWWIIDPDGGRFISKGINSVYQNKTTRNDALIAEHFGNDARWARDTKRMLRDHGFNTLGCWSDLGLLDQSQVKLPHTLYLPLMARFGRQLGVTKMGYGNNAYDGDAIPVFDPRFADYCEAQFAAVAERYEEDPWVLGVFSDNELPLSGDALSKYLALAEDNVNRKHAEQWWAQRRGDDDREPTDADEAAFLEHVCATYFRTVTAAMDRHLPNHLYLGPRLINSSANSDAVLRAGRDYVDIWCINHYGAWTPSTARMDRWLQLTGKPFIISEWYAKGMDTGLDNTGGAGWTVQNQQERGHFYQHFTLHLLAHPGNVGWHWFKYIDDAENDPSAKLSNKGILTADYQPYTPLLNDMAELNQQVYRLRGMLLDAQ